MFGTQYPELFAALTAPFPAHLLSERTKKPKDGPPITLTYVDAHVIADRLDLVLGAENWEVSLMPWGTDIIGMLTLTMPDGSKVSKQDAAGRPLLKPGGDPVHIPMSAVSHVLRRCGAMFGIGRYLYFRPGEKREVKPLAAAVPSAPTYKTPTRTPTPPPAPTPTAQLMPQFNGTGTPPAAIAAEAPTPIPPPAKPAPKRPATGPELLAYANKCKIDPELEEWIVGSFGHRMPRSIKDWTETQVTQAWPHIRDHLQRIKLTAQMTSAAPSSNGNGVH